MWKGTNIQMAKATSMNFLCKSILMNAGSFCLVMVSDSGPHDPHVSSSY